MLPHLLFKDPNFVDKSQKDSTPLESTSYPLRDYTHATPLLKERLNIIIDLLESKFNMTGFVLYLFGSQISGRSRSGQPDIDVMFYHKDLDTPTTGKLLWEHATAIRREVDFKLDLVYGKHGSPYNGLIFKK